MRVCVYACMRVCVYAYALMRLCAESLQPNLLLLPPFPVLNLFPHHSSPPSYPSFLYLIRTFRFSSSSRCKPFPLSPNTYFSPSNHVSLTPSRSPPCAQRCHVSSFPPSSSPLATNVKHPASSSCPSGTPSGNATRPTKISRISCSSNR